MIHFDLVAPPPRSEADLDFSSTPHNITIMGCAFSIQAPDSPPTVVWRENRNTYRVSLEYDPFESWDSAWDPRLGHRVSSRPFPRAVRRPNVLQTFVKSSPIIPGVPFQQEGLALGDLEGDARDTYIYEHMNKRLFWYDELKEDNPPLWPGTTSYSSIGPELYWHYPQSESSENEMLVLVRDKKQSIHTPKNRWSAPGHCGGSAKFRFIEYRPQLNQRFLGTRKHVIAARYRRTVEYWNSFGGSEIGPPILVPCLAGLPMTSVAFTEQTETGEQSFIKAIDVGFEPVGIEISPDQLTVLVYGTHQICIFDVE